MTNQRRPRQQAISGFGALLVAGGLALATSGGSSATADQTPDGAPNIVVAAGDLDPTFGQNGMVTTDIGPGGEEANAMAIQPDGKIVVVGETSGEASGGAEFALARYNPDGTLDVTFGGDGTVTTNLPSSGAYAVAIQADGRIVVVGGGSRFALVRYGADGTLDPTFDGDGVVTTNFTPKADVAYAVTIQADGRIVAAGVSGVVGTNLHFDDTKVALARYNADGSLDTSFGGDGRVTTNFTGTDDRAFATVTQSDGRIVVAGSAAAYRAFALARYNPDGSRDSAVGDNGKVTTTFTNGSFQFATAVAAQADGRLVVVGAEPRGVGFALARYKTNGALDRTFGEDGKVTTDFLTRHDLGYVGGWARGVAIQGDGKIVVAGGSAVGPGGDTEFALARYEQDGTQDPTFGGDGRVTTEWSIDGNDAAHALAIQDDGKIVTAGSSSDGPDGTFAMVRYLST